MFLLIIFLVCLFIVAGTGILAALSDIRGMVIPNMYSGIIIAAFFLCYTVMWLGGRDDVFAPFSSHLLSALVIFLLSLAMFAAKGIGGGDSKLATAFAFWMGLKGLIAFVFYMSLAGGVVALIGLALRKWKPFKIKRGQSKTWIARVQKGESKVPYGVAIVAGALASFLKIGYFDSEVLSSFILN